MKLRIESPGHRLSPSLKAFITDKIGKLDRYYADIQEIEVTVINELKANKETVTCTLNIRVPGKDEYVKTNSTIFEDAILKAADAAKSRFRTRKTQLEKARKAKSPNRIVAAGKATKKSAVKKSATKK